MTFCIVRERGGVYEHCGLFPHRLPLAELPNEHSVYLAFLGPSRAKLTCPAPVRRARHTPNRGRGVFAIHAAEPTLRLKIVETTRGWPNTTHHPKKRHYNLLRYCAASIPSPCARTLSPSDEPPLSRTHTRDCVATHATHRGMHAHAHTLAMLREQGTRRG